MRRLVAWVLSSLVMAVDVAPLAAQTFRSSAGDLMVETFARGLNSPWSLAFLPDGRMLVTERPGRLRIVGKDGKLSRPLAGVPKVLARAKAACSMSRSIAIMDQIKRSTSVLQNPRAAARARRWRALVCAMRIRHGSTR